MNYSPIYRIEWKDIVPNKKWGVGFFRFHANWYPNIKIDEDIFKKHSIFVDKYNSSVLIKSLKGPNKDFEEFYSQDYSAYIFGFTSITALKTCLGSRYLNQLLRLGFVVKKYDEYEHYKISKSGKQCIFQPLEEGELIDINKILPPVYRIEHINKKDTNFFEINPNVCSGIYVDMYEINDNEIINKMFKKHCHGTNFPCGRDDFREIIHLDSHINRIINNLNIPFDNFFYGFNSLKQLKKWFLKTELFELKKAGYVVKEFVNYEHVLLGESNKQVIFIPKEKGVEIHGCC